MSWWGTFTHIARCVPRSRQNRKVFAPARGLGPVTVREEREVDGPPAMVLAALATAGENRGYTVRDVRTDENVLLMYTGMKLRAASVGFLVTARARRRPRGSQLSVDVTPLLGSWGVEASREELDDLVQEFQAVMGAPKARIRRPDKAKPGLRPFGWTPEILAALWAISSLAIYGLGFGGWGWIPAAAGTVGAASVVFPQPSTAWRWFVTLCAVISIPFGALGPIARRLSLTNEYWADIVLR